MIKIEEGILFKYCTGCNQYLSYTHFFVTKSSKYDGLSWVCRTCESEKAKLRHLIYYQREKEKLKAYQKVHRLTIPPEERQRYNQEYRKKNHAAILEKERTYGKQRRITLGKDTIYRLNNNVGKGIWESLKCQKDGCHWESLVDYNLETLRCHLEGFFIEGMSWENYGKGIGKWCVDHTKPIVAFHITSPQDEEFKECWSLNNLRPMWSLKNSGKSSTWEGVRLRRQNA